MPPIMDRASSQQILVGAVRITLIITLSQVPDEDWLYWIDLVTQKCSNRYHCLLFKSSVVSRCQSGVSHGCFEPVLKEGGWVVRVNEGEEGEEPPPDCHLSPSIGVYQVSPAPDK
ncbi:hypothetical protein E2C01_086368 [Portunus trituberculatus]|uniref:Uncharacterized protein n=1 Tax=Portunus trituberculatus TaxID=210409 RepID=A0A5B7J3M1_PORTR|nr:hypothetical protein [Portunus trituberculatus]